MITHSLAYAFVHVTTMGGAKVHGAPGNMTIAKMGVSPELPPSSASQWWENAPLQQIDLSRIFGANATSSEATRTERAKPLTTNAHHAPLPGPNKSAVEKPRASPANQLARSAASSQHTTSFLKKKI